MNKTLNALLATALLGASSAASAVAIVYDASNTVSIPGIATSATYGDTMDGLSVTAVFDSGFTQTLAWADTGANAGGVSGTNWGLNLTGNTFGADWNFSNTSSLTLTQLVLDGAPGLTLFDVSTSDAGGSTPGSDAGITFMDTDGVAITATYSDRVAVGGNAAVGDIWQKLTIDFAGATANIGVAGNFRFDQDTDNDVRVQTAPSPAVLALLGIGLLGIGASRRFRA